MKTVHPTHINIELSVEEADWVKTTLFENESAGPKMRAAFDRIIQEIDEELKPLYVYIIKCQDCPNTYEYRTKMKLSKSEIKTVGICSICSDDYK
jgi:hypothetical protein